MYRDISVGHGMYDLLVKHDKYLEKVKKCNKQNLNIFTEPNLFIQHHERNWEDNVVRMDVDRILKEIVVSTPQRWEGAMF